MTLRPLAAPATIALLAFVGTARAEDSPTPAPTPARAPSPAPSAPIQAHASLEQIEEAYDGIEEEAVRAVRRRRYDAIFGYLRANPRAKDAEDATAALMRLADATKTWDKALLHADEYLAAWPTGKNEVSARFLRAKALGELDRTPEAKAAYEALTSSVSLARHGKQTVVAAWTHRAKFLTERGDFEGAKQAWRSFKAILASAPDGASYART